MSKVALLPPKTHRARRYTLIILAVAPFAFGLLALWLGQDANWDLRNYHWYNAYAFLNGRYGFDLLPSQTPYFYNPVLDVPFYLLATHAPAWLAGFVLGFVQGFNFILLFMLAYTTLIIADVRRKVAACAALALLGMLGGGGIALIGTTFYDNVTSLGLFLSALLIIRYREKLMSASEPHAFYLALLYGLPSGLMMGLKLPSVIFCIGLCFGFFFMGGSLRRLFVISFAFGVGVLLGVAVSLGPWAWYLQTHYANPLFPYFNDIFKSPLAPLSSARDEQFIPHSWHDILLFPFVFADSPYRVGEIPWRDWRIPILYALLPLLVVAHVVLRRKRSKDFVAPPASRFLLAAGAISYFIWLKMFCIYRYAVPLEMITPLLIVMAVGLLPIKLRMRAALAGALILIVAVSVQGGNWSRRDGWLDHFVEIKIPPLPLEDKPMILMAGFEPYSHLVPEFPKSIPFVRIQSNFASPDQNKGINDVLHERVEAHTGSYMLLMPAWQMKLASDALAYYHLIIVEGSCQTLIDRLYDDEKINLCKLARTATG